MTGTNRFAEIQAWQACRELTNAVYLLPSRGPFSKDFGLRDHIRRASVSTMSNISEAFESRNDTQFINYLGTARASAGEVRPQLYVALDQHYIAQEQFDETYARAEKSARQIARFIRYPEQNPRPHRAGEEQATHDVWPSTFDAIQ